MRYRRSDRVSEADCFEPTPRGDHPSWGEMNVGLPCVSPTLRELVSSPSFSLSVLHLK